MYIAPADRSFGDDEWRPFVVAQGFGHLVAAGAGREVPVVVPTQYLLDGDEVLLHLAGPNPMLDALAEQPRALLSVAGDWAYIPSAWKAIGDEDPLAGIPTTYYAAVQLVGTATVDDDPAAIAAVLRRQLQAVQPDLEVADPLDAHGPRLRGIRAVTLAVEEVRAKFKYGGNVDDAHGPRLRGIRAVTLAVEEVRAKFKYGGNVDDAHRASVIERLRERSGPGDLVAAAHTERRGGRRAPA